MRRVPTPLRWAIAALVGLALAATLTSAASRLSSQHIGLSTEPLTAGDRLVARPPPRHTPTPTASRTPSRTPSPTPSATATAAPTASGGDGESGGDD